MKTSALILVYVLAATAHAEQFVPRARPHQQRTFGSKHACEKAERLWCFDRTDKKGADKIKPRRVKKRG